LHPRNITAQMAGLRRLTHAFVENPETILQELVDSAVILCGADSAGISLETAEKSDSNFYHWVATAGQYSGFLDAVLPKYPSACGVCLLRNSPQHFRVTDRFFEILGVEAPTVTDGILLPWKTEENQGTIFVMAHGRTEAFDREDLAVMEVLADFAAMAVRHQAQQKAVLKQTSAAAAAEMANDLAHQINNPLQSLINLAYIAEGDAGSSDVKALAREMSGDLKRLSILVSKLLSLPSDTTQRSSKS
jgi:hypothetical protein